MKKNFYKGAMLTSVLAVCMLLLVGCGTNLFEGFADEPEETDPIDLIKQASSPEDYNKVEEVALIVISSENANPEQKQDALIGMSALPIAKSKLCEIKPNSICLS